MSAVRTAVVTGAGRGIGLAIAQRLAGDGWQVVVTGRDAEQLREACNGLTPHEAGHSYRELDVTDVGAVSATASEIAEIGGLHAWVNNAGISRVSRFLDVTLEQYTLVHDVNLKGTFFGTQAAAREMVKANICGSIVNVASLASKTGVPLLSDYVAAKFGVVGLTQASAIELGPAGIRVNAVCPGFVLTNMQEQEELAESILTGVSAETIRESFISQSLFSRLQTTDEIAGVVAFLLSDDAAMITGESMAVNAGAFMD